MNDLFTDKDYENINLDYPEGYLEMCVKELQQENKQLKEQIQDALGIANERINYYFHINNEEVLKDWKEIFDALRGDSNE